MKSVRNIFAAIINARQIPIDRKIRKRLTENVVIALKMCRNGPPETGFFIKITNSTNHQIYMKFDEVLHFQHHNTMFNNVHLCFYKRRTTNPLLHTQPLSHRIRAMLVHVMTLSYRHHRNKCKPVPHQAYVSPLIKYSI